MGGLAHSVKNWGILSSTDHTALLTAVLMMIVMTLLIYFVACHSL